VIKALSYGPTGAIVAAVAARWTEPDHGIWEIRAPRKHYVHSKLMCWTAVDRALRIAKVFTGAENEQWRQLRERIAHDVLTRAWNPTLRSFTAAYGEAVLDAATLLIGLVGLLSPDDPRFIATTTAVEKTLREGPTVHRYLYDDGLPGREGGFHLCTCWMIEAYAALGRRDDARKLFEEFVGLLGLTGLGPEEYCPRSRRSLGNHPQLYTHLGLINAALALSAL
jgi:GH15 family glucan-1,4-alpha-glucosidase